MAAGFYDLLAWMLGWQSAVSGTTKTFVADIGLVSVAGDRVGSIHAGGDRAGSTFAAGDEKGYVRT